jgi:glycerate kinase
LQATQLAGAERNLKRLAQVVRDSHLRRPQFCTRWPRVQADQPILRSGTAKGAQINPTPFMESPQSHRMGAHRDLEPGKAGIEHRTFNIQHPTSNSLEINEGVFRFMGREPGAGAAGGLGFGLLAFLGARLEPGFDLFARFAKLDQRLRAADLVITGEGSVDASTFMGKGAGQIARRCRQSRISCIGLAGVTAGLVPEESGFTSVHALTELTTPAKAKLDAAYWLEQLANSVAVRLHAV